MAIPITGNRIGCVSSNLSSSILGSSEELVNYISVTSKFRRVKRTMDDLSENELNQYHSAKGLNLIICLSEMVLTGLIDKHLYNIKNILTDHNQMRFKAKSNYTKIRQLCDKVNELGYQKDEETFLKFVTISMPEYEDEFIDAGYSVKNYIENIWCENNKEAISALEKSVRDCYSDIKSEFNREMLINLELIRVYTEADDEICESIKKEQQNRLKGTGITIERDETQFISDINRQAKAFAGMYGRKVTNDDGIKGIESCANQVIDNFGNDKMNAILQNAIEITVKEFAAFCIAKLCKDVKDYGYCCSACWQYLKDGLKKPDYIKLEHSIFEWSKMTCANDVLDMKDEIIKSDNKSFKVWLGKVNEAIYG